MDTLKEYENADYVFDMFFDRTTSLPEGLQERLQFEPNLARPMRRMNSADDIQRYKDHFAVAQRNQGPLFKWRHYLKVLRDDLRHFNTLVLMNKTLLSHLTSPTDSEKSLYVTASEAETMQKTLPSYRMDENKSHLVRREDAGDIDSLACISSASSVMEVSISSSNSMSPPTMQKTLPKYRMDENKSYLCRRENALDTDSLASINSASSVTGVSINSTSSMSPQKKLLKKFCSEICQLASKARRTVEKMAGKKKCCSACKDYIQNVKNHKNCSQLVNLIDNKRFITTSKLTNANLARTISMTSMTSIGSGESEVFDNRLPLFPKKKGYPRRMLPFVKENR